MVDKITNPLPVIRQYTSKDLGSCRALWVELTEWHRHIYQSPSIGGPNPGNQFDEHLNRVGPENIWVAEVEGQVVGLTGLILMEDGAELEPIVVSKAYRGSGIGRKLVNTVIEAARSNSVRQLSVRPVGRNEQAIRFFHELGFDVLGHIELFIDFGTAGSQEWQDGEQIAGVNFRV
jgi:ribosomal protein S18 acetylase RimI-like enzyme